MRHASRVILSRFFLSHAWTSQWVLPFFRHLDLELIEHFFPIPNGPYLGWYHFWRNICSSSKLVILKVSQTYKRLWIILRFQDEVVKVWLFQTFPSWHATEKNLANYSNTHGGWNIRQGCFFGKNLYINATNEEWRVE